ncbi:MAG: RluA family pseudouridine synthase [Candidatus Komeilibacteria bacterium]
MTKLNFTVNIDEPKVRLDVFLHENLKDRSRSFIQKNIKAGNVKVDDKVEKTVHCWLKNNDTVEWRTNDVKEVVITPPAIEKVEVLFESDEYIVINKPAKLLVHALPDKPNTPSLIDWLIDKYPQTRQLGENPLRPALVHRLDKEVSGLMVIPLTQDMLDYFKQQFKLRKVTKEYTALVYGNFEDVEGEINLPISRSKNTGRMAAHSIEQGGKPAITNFEVVERYTNHTLLKIHIETGRTNQIRVHMQALGHALVGDTLYTNKNITKPIDLGRVFLHASYLEFVLPSGEKVNYFSELPKKLIDLLKTLK